MRKTLPVFPYHVDKDGDVIWFEDGPVKKSEVPDLLQRAHMCMRDDGNEIYPDLKHQLLSFIKGVCVCALDPARVKTSCHYQATIETLCICHPLGFFSGPIFFSSIIIFVLLYTHVTLITCFRDESRFD